MKSYFVPFVVSLIGYGVLFVVLDMAVMSLQGLSLLFQQ